MMRKRLPDSVVARWMSIPEQLRRAARGATRAQLDAHRSPKHLSIRETVHHLVEANLIASNIIISAMARNGMAFDWTWVMPGGEWMNRLGYDRAPIGPAIATLGALSRHVAALLATSPDGLDRRVQLYDAPGAPRYEKTVREILDDEAKHAREHLDALPRRRR